MAASSISRRRALSEPRQPCDSIQPSLPSKRMPGEGVRPT